MAPPASASMKGSMAWLTLPSVKPSHTPTISSRPMANDSMKVRSRERPATSSGAMTTMPSGTCCSAMPSDTVHCVASSPFMLTPAAMPSGNL